MVERKLIFSGEYYGPMLRCELCNKTPIQTKKYIPEFGFAVPAITVFHAHEHCNHLGYAGFGDEMFLLIHLN